MTSSSKFHVRKPYFVRLEKLNEAWFGDLDRIDPSGFSRFGPPQEVVCFEFFVFFFWMFFFRNLQPINHIENLRVSIPPPKGKKKKNNLPPPPLKGIIISQHINPSGKAWRQVIGIPKWFVFSEALRERHMAERLAQFGAVELGALLQKVKGFWGSEVWLSLGGLHTHFFPR